jgi:hypothetical protein
MQHKMQLSAIASQAAFLVTIAAEPWPIAWHTCIKMRYFTAVMQQRPVQCRSSEQPARTPQVLCCHVAAL